ncbi:MAG TPA: hypothetical protein VGG20_26305 [Thermoanaerobaculia bacterium]|jgi:hypothetical protein
MDRKRSSFLPILLVLAVLSGLGARDVAAQPGPAGPETRVDSPVDSPESATGLDCPLLAVAPDQSTEIVWSDFGDGGDPPSLLGRHYAPDGTATDPEPVQLASAGDPDHALHAELLSPLPKGFRLIFGRFDTVSSSPSMVFSQRLNLSGRPAPGPPLSVGAADTQWILPGPGGVLYASRTLAGQKSIVIQQISSTGAPAGPRIVVNDRPIYLPDLQMVPLGAEDFVAVWSGLAVPSGHPFPRQVIRARRFHRGAPAGKEFDVASLYSGLRFVVAADPASGGFAVAWPVPGNLGDSIHLRFFGASGRPDGREQVAVPSGGYPIVRDAAFDDSGDLLLLWQVPTNGGGLRARAFGSTGGRVTTLGPAFPVNSEASGAFDSQGCGHAAWAAGSWRITWEAGRSDGGSDAIFVRAFTKGS